MSRGGWSNIPYVWYRLPKEVISREKLEEWRQYVRRYIFPSDRDVPSIGQEMISVNCDIGVARYFLSVEDLSNADNSRIRVNGYPVKVGKDVDATNIYKYLYIEPPRDIMQWKKYITNIRQPIKRKPSWNGLIHLLREGPYGDGVSYVSRGSSHFIWGDIDDSFLKKMNEICRLLSYMYPTTSETVEKEMNGYQIIMEPGIWMRIVVLTHFTEMCGYKGMFYHHNIWYKEKGKNSFSLCGEFRQEHRAYLFLYPEIKHVKKTGCYYFRAEYLPLVQNIFHGINLVNDV